MTMFKRLCLAAGFTAALLALSPSIGGAQEARRVRFEWENAPLSQVVRAFAAFSGRTIVVAPDVGDPAVTATVQSVDWRAALELILVAHGLVARADASGNIRIEKEGSRAAKP
jgi:ferric-dicitrate binding protein FerR (iron transport regulator)